MRIVYADLGLDPDPARWPRPRTGCTTTSANCSTSGLPWCDGAREMLDALAAAGVPMALVTNTRRGLTEKALNSIGSQYFSVIGVR